MGGGKPRFESAREILAEIRAEHRAWIDLLSGLTEDEASRRVDDGWSAIDSLIHVTAWQENAMEIARLQADRDAPVIDPNRGPGGVLHIDVDAFNEELLVSHRDWPIERALAWSEDVNAELRAALAVLPMERLVGGRGPGGTCQWFGLPAIRHSREHRRAAQARLDV